MMKYTPLVLSALLAASAYAPQARAADRFEVTSIKAVRPTIVDTIAALQQRDLIRAREAFEAYDSAWNGIEVYINVRSRELYQALEHGFQLGAHGLPLMGTGDWNDGMNKVGAHGKGESVWNGWFLLTCLHRFADLADSRGDSEWGTTCREQAEKLRAAIEEHAWDGAWYRRAYFDDGMPLGSAQNDECQIDSLPQAWAVISGAADPARAERAMASVEERLVHPDDKLIQLFDPPFDRGPLQPGYINRSYASAWGIWVLWERAARLCCVVRLAGDRTPFVPSIARITRALQGRLHHDRQLRHGLRFPGPPPRLHRRSFRRLARPAPRTGPHPPPRRDPLHRHLRRPLRRR